MPVTWEIRGDRLRLVVAGERTFEDLERVLPEILASPLLRPGLSVLVDVRGARSNPSAEEIRDRATRMAPFLAQGAFAPRCAIVTGPDPHRYGVNRSLAAVAAGVGVKVGVFQEIDEA